MSYGTSLMLRLGLENWPFPVPLKKSGQEWSFDAVAGREELLNRRIGRHELLNLETCERLRDAQEAYRSADRDGDRVRAAQRGRAARRPLLAR
ncbi:MAG: DUF2950 family protein [Armatimonadetes bacterium]|nr:DUF2950 family protein [Armatimonadota bacterium]